MFISVYTIMVKKSKKLKWNGCEYIITLKINLID